MQLLELAHLTLYAGQNATALPPHKKKLSEALSRCNDFGGEGGGGLSFKFLRYVVRLAGHVHAGGGESYITFNPRFHWIRGPAPSPPSTDTPVIPYRKSAVSEPGIGEKKKKKGGRLAPGTVGWTFFLRKKKCRAYATHKKKKKKRSPQGWTTNRTT